MREKRLYKPIIELFNKLGYHKVQKEVPIFENIITGKRVDLVFINGVKKSAVEVKVKDWEKALFQAYLNAYFFDKSYVALPKDIVDKLNLEIFKAYHVGVISVHKRHTEIVLEARGIAW